MKIAEVQADTYRLETRVAMLRMLCSIDADERDRAEAHSGDLAMGLIPTPSTIEGFFRVHDTAAI